MKKVFCALSIVVSLLNANPGFSLPTQTLDTVVVTATRAPRPATEVISSVTVITADDIAASGAAELAEALQDSVGLQVVSQGPVGSVASVSIRGSQAGQVLVLLDGIRLNSPQLGQFNLSDLPVSLKEIDRIEVLRGPASALYGSNALAGVIQIFTRQPESEPLTRLSWSEASSDTRHLSFSSSRKLENFRCRLSAASDHSQGYRDNSAFDGLSLNGSLGYILPSGFDLGLSLNHLDKEQEVPGPTTWLTPEAEQRDENTDLALTLNGPLGPVNLQGKGIYQRHRNEYRDPGGWNPVDDTHIIETLGSELQGEIATEGQTVIVGADFYRDELDSTANGKVDQDRWSLFSQYEIEANDRAAFMFGLRYDAHSDFSNEWSPRAGARFSLSNSTTLRLSAGRAYRAPTLNDRYWPDTGWTKGNPDLEPETGWEYELAVDQQLGKIGQLTVAGFRRDVEDLIDWAPLDPSDPFSTWQPNNIGKARILGVEADLKLRLHRQLNTGVNYTYLDPKNRVTDEVIPGKPRHQGSAYLEVGPFHDAKLRLDGRFIDHYPEPQRQDDSHAVFDVTLTRPFLIGHDVELEMILTVKNLFDKDYEENVGYPMPPRQLHVGLTAYF